MPNPIILNLRNDFAEIEKAQDKVSECGMRLGFPAKTLFQINLAIEEILTNVIKYAFDDQGSHEFTMSFSMDHSGFEAEVIDSGKPFDPLAAPTPDLDLPIEKRPIGGLGIHLVRSIMDEVAYERRDGKNHFRMKKAIKQP